MHRIQPLTALAAAALVVLFVAGTITAYAEDPYEIYEEQGKLTEVNPEYGTVVVEVPKNGQDMTVAGKLVPNANVTKKENMAKLKDFEVDEQVTVKWMKTDKGLNILELHQK